MPRLTSIEEAWRQLANLTDAQRDRVEYILGEIFKDDVDPSKCSTVDLAMRIRRAVAERPRGGPVEQTASEPQSLDQTATARSDLPIRPPPDGVHVECKTCDEHYLSMEAQQSLHYVGVLEHTEAQQLLRNTIAATREDLEHLRNKLRTHGDLILSRWSKKGKKGEDKRARWLNVNAEDMFGPWPTSDEKRDCHVSHGASYSEAENQELLQGAGIGIWRRGLWIDILGFASDHMRMLSLVHVRATHPPEDRAAFDTMECRVMHNDAPLYYNRKAVVMHGPEFGTLVDFDVGPAHSWAVAGFPRAEATISAQRCIASMLRRVLDQIVGDSPPSGCSEWTFLTNRGLSSSHDSALWSSSYHQPFVQPSEFVSEILVEKACDALRLVEDEIELMQTSPEYMRRYALQHKATRFFVDEVTANQRFEATAWSMMSHWTNQLATLQRIAVACETLQRALHTSGDTTEPGKSLTESGNAAMEAFGRFIITNLIEQCNGMFHLLINVSPVKDSFGSDGNGEVRSRKVDDLLERVYFAAGWLRASIEQPLLGTSSYALSMLIEELPASACDKTMDFHLSTMALLDEFYRAWSWSQMGTHHGRGVENATHKDVDARYQIGIYVPTSKKGRSSAPSDRLMRPDEKNGILLRALCTAPVPKGGNKLSSIRKTSANRKVLAEFWQSMRQDWKIIQDQESAEQAPVDAVIGKMSCDLSPDYLSQVETENATIALAAQHQPTSTTVEKMPTQYVQPDWDAQAAGDRPSNRKRTKRKQREMAGIEIGVDDLVLCEVQPTDDDDEVANAVPHIAVKQDTLAIMAMMFSSEDGNGGGRVRWLEFAKALNDAGMVHTQGGGSAVTFKSLEGSISFHKPHPDPVLDSLVLRHFGKRLYKWFGWNDETFVLRPKDNSG